MPVARPRGKYIYGAYIVLYTGCHSRRHTLRLILASSIGDGFFLSSSACFPSYLSATQAFAPKRLEAIKCDNINGVPDFSKLLSIMCLISLAGLAAWLLRRPVLQVVNVIPYNSSGDNSAAVASTGTCLAGKSS